MTKDVALHDTSRILVIGASGFVGWNAVRRYCARGNTVGATFLTRTHYLHSVPDCVPLRLDITEGSAVEAAVSRFQPTLVLHLAARARPQLDTDPDELARVNVDGTAHVARACALHGIPLVYLSTDIVYPDNAGLCNESSRVEPARAAPYAASKLRAEEAVRSLAPRHAILRPSIIYGAYGGETGGFARFLDESWSRGERASVFTDQVRSFLYVGDLLDAIDAVVGGEMLNDLYLVGGAEALTRAEFARRYALYRGLDPELVLAPMCASELAGYKGDRSDIRLDTGRLRSLGWSPHSVEETFAMMEGEKVVTPL